MLRSPEARVLWFFLFCCARQERLAGSADSNALKPGKLKRGSVTLGAAAQRKAQKGKQRGLTLAGESGKDGMLHVDPRLLKR